MPAEARTNPDIEKVILIICKCIYFSVNICNNMLSLTFTIEDLPFVITWTIVQIPFFWDVNCWLDGKRTGGQEKEEKNPFIIFFLSLSPVKIDLKIFI